MNENEDNVSFYLGASLKDRLVAKRAIEILSLNLACTFDWTGDHLQRSCRAASLHLDAGKVEKEYNEQPAKRMQAIRDADFCVFLLGEDNSIVHVEMGASMALNKPTHLIPIPGYDEKSAIPFYNLGTSALHRPGCIWHLQIRLKEEAETWRQYYECI